MDRRDLATPPRATSRHSGKSSSASTEPRATVVPRSASATCLPAHRKMNSVRRMPIDSKFTTNRTPLRIGVLRRLRVRRELVRLLRAVDEDDTLAGRCSRKIPQRLEQDTDGQEVVRGAGLVRRRVDVRVEQDAPFSSAPAPFKRATTQATSSYTPTKPPRNCAWSTAPRTLRHSCFRVRHAPRRPGQRRTRAPRPARVCLRNHGATSRATRGSLASVAARSASNPAGAGTRRRQSALLPRMRTRQEKNPAPAARRRLAPGARRPRRRSSSLALEASATHAHSAVAICSCVQPAAAAARPAPLQSLGSRRDSYGLPAGAIKRLRCRPQMMLFNALCVFTSAPRSELAILRY